MSDDADPHEPFVNLYTAAYTALGAPTNAVFPSAERATELPNCAYAPAVDVSGDAEPHEPFVNLYTAAYPSAEEAPTAPTIAVFPSAERATE